MYKWIRKDVVETLHKMQVSEHGGEDGLRDDGLLESALARPINKYDYEKPDITLLAASYAFGIIKNHPFFDGNKRTALVAGLTFLKINGYSLDIKKDELYNLFIMLASSKISENQFASEISKHLIKK